MVFISGVKYYDEPSVNLHQISLLNEYMFFHSNDLLRDKIQNEFGQNGWTSYSQKSHI